MDNINRIKHGWAHVLSNGQQFLLNNACDTGRVIQTR